MGDLHSLYFFFFNFLFTKSPSPGDREEIFRFSNQAAHRSTTHGGGFTLSVKQGSCINPNFYRISSDPTGNRNQVFRFSNRRSIHSNADRTTILQFLR